MTIEDKEIIVILPLKTWRIVVAYLEGGIYRDVLPILGAIYGQVNPQAIAAEKAEAERAAAEAALVEERIKAAAAASAPQSAGPPEDSPAEPISIH